MGAHARFSPSAANRLIHCPPSLVLGEAFQEEESPYAAEGSAGHALAEHLIKKHLKQQTRRPVSDYYSDDLLEAAAIDGCGPIKTFFTIVMPISGTVYATIFILDFVAHWNDFMWPMLVVTGEDMRTIQLAIQTFFGSKPIHYGAIMASLTISAIPMLLMFVFLQKYYVEGIASTGIKG